MTISRTTAQDVLDLFNVTKPASMALARWRKDATKAEVVPHVMSHVTSAVYTLSPSDMERVCLETAHALGKVQRAAAEGVTAIVDWHPNFAFTHTLHYVVETLEHVPTWQEFIEFVRTDPQGKAMLWDPVVEHVLAVHQAADDLPLKRAWDSMGWRVGNAYHSFLREIYVVVNLRDAGLDVRMHPLADALFRVDFWCARTVCSLLVKNAKFHKDEQGRKIQTSELLGDAVPPFQFQKIQLDKASRFGVVHLPSPEDIRLVARELQSALHSTRVTYR